MASKTAACVVGIFALLLRKPNLAVGNTTLLFTLHVQNRLDVPKSAVSALKLGE